MVNCSFFGMTDILGLMEQTANVLNTIRDNCLT